MTKGESDSSRATGHVATDEAGSGAAVAGPRSPRRAALRTLFVAVSFTWLGFVAGSRVSPSAVAAAPDAPFPGLQVGQGCDAGLLPGHPPIGTGLGLPPGHPPVGYFPRLPPGHPPIRSTPPVFRFEPPRVISI